MSASKATTQDQCESMEQIRLQTLNAIGTEAKGKKKRRRETICSCLSMSSGTACPDSGLLYDDHVHLSFCLSPFIALHFGPWRL